MGATRIDRGGLGERGLVTGVDDRVDPRVDPLGRFNRCTDHLTCGHFALADQFGLAGGVES